ncbi:transposase [Rickettsia endosymbiont of Cantharis rufa]|uniref:transposase n=1 Tax=Rickettsia endosymbiont of Cantharis rufa TaxID=3066248 RepID=UPI003978A4ED
MLAGARSDQGYKDYLQDINPNDLLIADLGYFVPKSFSSLSAKGAYFISRYKTDTNIYDRARNKLDLLELLEKVTF